MSDVPRGTLDAPDGADVLADLSGKPTTYADRAAVAVDQKRQLQEIKRLHYEAVLAATRHFIRGVTYDVVFLGCAPMLLLLLFFILALRWTR